MSDDFLIPQRHTRVWLDMLLERETHWFYRVNYRTKLKRLEAWKLFFDRMIEEEITRGRARVVEEYRTLRWKVDVRECVASVCIQALGALR